MQLGTRRRQETQPLRFFTASHVHLRIPDAFSPFKKAVAPVFTDSQGFVQNRFKAFGNY